jgi:dihydroflavonol-4-reductase
MPVVLVTGATGCIGSNLVLELARRGHEVRILCRPSSDLDILDSLPVQRFTGDICDSALLRAATRGCTTVYHAAALVTFARSAEKEQIRVNVLGTREVVRACLESGVATLVHTSSVTSIGYPPAGTLADEGTPLQQASPRGYKLSKVLAEDEVRDGIAQGLRAVIVNPSVVIGERDSRFHGGQLVRDSKRGRILFWVEGGMNVVYVGDVVKGMRLAAERGRTGERYILGGENLTHEEIFRRTAAIVGSRQPIAKLPLGFLKGVGVAAESLARLTGTKPLMTADLASAAGRFNWYSSVKAERELGYSMTSFDEAVSAAYLWYKEHGLL